MQADTELCVVYCCYSWHVCCVLYVCTRYGLVGYVAMQSARSLNVPSSVWHCVRNVQASAVTSSTYSDVGTGLTIDAHEANAVCTRCGRPAMEFVQVRWLLRHCFSVQMAGPNAVYFMWKYCWFVHSHLQTSSGRSEQRARIQCPNCGLL